MRMTSHKTPIDYLAVGHICSDLTPKGTSVGGTVAYAGRTACALDNNTAVLTSAEEGYNWPQALPAISVHSVPAAYTTTFENIYGEKERRQKIYHVAEKLKARHVPESWRHSRIVHLGPVANEIDTEMIHHFSRSLIGLTPQGWMRQWDETGNVQAKRWPTAASIFPLADAVIVSEEDLIDDEMLSAFRKWSRLLVLTQGKNGCTLFSENEAKQIPTKPVDDANPTGAGDIFAAAFLTRLQQAGGNPTAAAQYANKIASATVAQPNFYAKIRAVEQILGKS